MLKVLKARLGGLFDSILRYPMTAVFLSICTVLISVGINSRGELMTVSILTCAVAAAAGYAMQSLHERTRYAPDDARRGAAALGLAGRALLYGAGLLIAAVFYLTIRALPQNGPQMQVRFFVTLFALMILAVWCAVVKSRYAFHESFMAAFKALFQAAFFSGVIYLGCVAVIAAIDRLIAPIDSDAFLHTANIVFVLFAPLFYLSLLPVYPGSIKDGREPENQAALDENMARRVSCPRFLEVLLSYIIIPLASVFTVILLVYIALNIGGRFWTDNLLEPMLVAYSAVVLVVLLLSAGLDNRFARLFRSIFPKVLVVIALFQVIASFFTVADTGLTYGRYFVVLFGLFAVFSGAVFSFSPSRKSGVVAVCFLILALISLTPPVDAFSVSRYSQTLALERTLVSNGMLTGGVLTPKASVPEKDKNTIIAAVDYLTSTKELGRLSWLPEELEEDPYNDRAFTRAFGFSRFSGAGPMPSGFSVYYDMAQPLSVSGYDCLLRLNVTVSESFTPSSTAFVSDGSTYSLITEKADKTARSAVRDSGGTVLVTFDTGAIFSRYADHDGKELLTAEEATFTAEGDGGRMKIVVEYASMDEYADRTYQNAQLSVLVGIK
jgi:hypothetical protein